MGSRDSRVHPCYSIWVLFLIACLWIGMGAALLPDIGLKVDPSEIKISTTDQGVELIEFPPLNNTFIREQYECRECYATTRNEAVVNDDLNVDMVAKSQEEERVIENRTNTRVSKSAPFYGLNNGPLTFGHGIDVDIDIEERGTWVLQPANSLYRIWRLRLRSPTALSINLLFDKFYLPNGTSLNIRNNKASFNAFTSAMNNVDNMKFATAPLPGNYIDLEYMEPTFVTEKVILHIVSVVHGFRLAEFIQGAASHCHVNAPACDEAKPWLDQTRAVAVLMTSKGRQYCSGAMINNALMDGSQYFLTAEHCLEPSMHKDYNIIMFNYHSDQCPQSAMIWPLDNFLNGLTVVVRNRLSDYALLRVDQRIPESFNVFMAGWSISKTNPLGAACIHHPSGDVKKISIKKGSFSPGGWDTAAPEDEVYHWKVTGWDAGSTESGSSGSPLFSDKGLIIGQLHSGSSSCHNMSGEDYYGALFASYNLGLKKYLNPTNMTNLVSVEGIDLNTIREQHGKLLQAKEAAPMEFLAATHVVE